MNETVTLREEEGRHVDVVTGDGQLLWRYVYGPETPVNEGRRPYAHPVCSRAGDVLTNFRPNDHPWHHALSMTLTSVDGVNFWGGPSYRKGEGYRWREDHGEQVHRAWEQLEAGAMVEALEWRRAGQGARTEALLSERRVLETRIHEGGWSLRWTSELRNVAGRELGLGNYHASEGLAGSHYTGLQFRGARELLDEHGDERIGVRAEGGLRGAEAVHGVAAPWLEWSCQHDGSLRRTRIRFECVGARAWWFVRANNPLVAFAFHREEPQRLAVGATLKLEHVLTFTPE